jgi:penicillin amidase
MEAEWKSYAPDAQQIIEAFVGGVNAWIAETGDRLPIEFKLAGYRPEPWTPEVCLTRTGWVCHDAQCADGGACGPSWRTGLGQSSWTSGSRPIPPRRLEIPGGLDLAGIGPRILAAANAAGGPVSFKPSDGSNNWVVDGSMTDLGQAAAGKRSAPDDRAAESALPGPSGGTGMERDRCGRADPARGGRRTQ